MDVLLGYSDALSGVAAAGAEAQQTTEALGDSIMRLADMVPVTRPGVNLGQLLVRTGIQIKAYHDLDQAVGAAHSALAEVAKNLEADLEDLRRLYVKASQDMEIALDDEYGKRESDRKKLLAKRNEFRKTLLETFNEMNVEQVKKIEELVAHMAPEHREYVQRLGALRRQRHATVQMFGKAKQGVRAWVQAHGELKLAIAQNRQPNVRLVLSTAQEIRDAIARIGNH